MSRSRRRNARNGKPHVAKRLIPLLVIGAGLLVIGSAILVFTRTPLAESGTPRLVVEQELFDYGEVAFNTPIQTVFVVRNEGDAPLRIEGTPIVEVREGC